MDNILLTLIYLNQQNLLHIYYRVIFCYIYRKSIIGSDTNTSGYQRGVAEPQRPCVHEPRADVGQHGHRYHDEPGQKNVRGLCERKTTKIRNCRVIDVHYLPGRRC